MNFRFIIEFLLGAICFTAVILFGDYGYYSFALWLLLLVTHGKKHKLDEREKQLFYKVGNLTFGLTIMVLWIIFNLSHDTINGNLVVNYWYWLSISGIMFTHGIAGLIIFRTN